MNILCSDGSTRDFVSLSTYLEQHGFDPVLLENDHYMLELGIPPHLSVIKAFRLACRGVFLPEYFWHWSKASKKKNNANVSAKVLATEIGWIAFDSSFESITQEALGGRMDRFTFMARFALNIWNFVRGNLKSTPTINDLLLGRKSCEFNYGYKNNGYFYATGVGTFALHLSDQNGGDFGVQSSILGWTRYIYISRDD